MDRMNEWKIMKQLNENNEWKTMDEKNEWKTKTTFRDNILILPHLS